jgi:rare lipoprotein A
MKVTSTLTLIFLLVFSLISNAQIQTGKASFYADKFEGKMTASGDKYKHSKLTAAHKTLPFGTKVKVTNLANNESVEVVVNDRGPYVDGRVIDLSKSAAEKLGYVNKGLAEVRVEVVDAGDGKGGGPIVPIDKVVVDEKEFYDFEIERFQPKGFGIQIGTFQELVNLMRLSDNLKSSYQKKVTVQVKVLNGVKYYSIILGQFSTRNKADKFLAEVKPKFPDAFIAEFDKLK